MALNLDAIKAKLNQLNKTDDKKSNIWKPEAGKTRVRIVPYVHRKENPFLELYFHYDIGKKTMLSPITFGNADPIVEFAKQLRKTNDKENWKLAKKLDPKMRIFAPVIVRGEEHLGVRLWEFGKEIYLEFLSLADDEDIGDYTDIYEGRDITVDTVGPDVTGTAYNKSSIRVKTKQSPLDENKETVKKWLDEQPNPTELYKRYEFDEMKRLLQEWLNPEEAAPASTVEADEEEEIVQPAKPNYALTAKESKVDKFDSLFGDDDDLPF